MRSAGVTSKPTTDKREHHYLDRMRHHSGHYREFHRPSVELLVNLFYTYDVVYTRASREAERAGLSTAAFNVLLILSRCGDEGCPMHEVGELLLVSRANVTGLVDCLERRELVERAVHAEDRRVRLVRLTKAGGALLEGMLPRHYGEIRGALSVISDREKSELSRLLMKLRRGVQRADRSSGER